MASVAPHTFEMPSVFTAGNVEEERRLRSNAHIYPINMDLVERFRSPEYRMAMIRELMACYTMYRSDKLVSLDSEYCLKTTYTDDHETLDTIFDRHVELTCDDDDIVKIAEIHDRIVHDDKWEGSKKKLRIYAHNRCKRHRSVQFVTTGNRPALRGARLKVIESVMAQQMLDGQFDRI
jgi:hypothetical protein